MGNELTAESELRSEIGKAIAAIEQNATALKSSSWLTGPYGAAVKHLAVATALLARLVGEQERRLQALEDGR